ncbi:MAG: polysaccharide biosynthesis C-terminal domain-containing protein, partial [Oscillospiraceae bacterium]|nr:polysaccharide biosynthesis C-terminal domain-containing protein [Oscillospiraceae bacterium]
VMPVLTFASVFFLALSEQLIPALTRAQVRRDRSGLEATAGGSLRLSLLLSSGVALVLWLLGPTLGRWLYRSGEAGELIRALAPLVIVMYLDTVVDGMLKGLGLQLDSMLINLADACLTLLAVWFLLPRFGVPAYIAILYGSECFNFLLSFLRLSRSVRTKLL